MKSRSVLHGRRLTYFIPVFCCLIIVFDGYDVSVYGTTLPALLTYQPWHLGAAEAGFIASLSLFGLLLGSLLCGFVTDLLGRKRMLVFCSSWFSVFMLASAAAPSSELFGLFRFLSGLGLGGVIPVCIALIVEFAPPARRYLFTGFANAGFSLGAIVAALLGIVVIPEHGFRPMYAIAGVVLLLMPVAMLLLPESVDFLVAKGRLEEARAVAQRCGLPAPASPAVDPEPRTETGFRDLLRRPFLRNLILFGVTGFAVQVFIYGLNTWLPQLMRSAGYGLTSALSFLAAMSVGAIVGSVLMAMSADRFGPRRVLVAGLGVGIVALAVLSFGPPTVAVYAAVVLAGVGGNGTAVVVHVFTGMSFPAAVRASAVGSYMAISRVGSIAGPFALGWITAVGLPVRWDFFALMVPTVVGMFVVFLLPRGRPGGHPTAPVAAEPKEQHAKPA